MRDLRGATVVVTGGSSGIGLATVERTLDAGSTVVAVARGRDALEQVARDLADRPGRLEIADLDVTDAAAVQRFADDIRTRFGRIDAWVNAAGVATYGRFEDVPTEEFDRVVAVNLLGSANGARAVLPGFRAQGSGVLVNVSSVLGRFGTPLMSSYVASKFAVRGWSESLRMELRDLPGVHVCTILPGPVDTPLFQHAGDHTGERAKAPPAPMDPHRVAAAIVGVLLRPRREVVVHHGSRLVFLGRAIAPGLTERILGAGFARVLTLDEPAEATSGNLHRSLARAEVSGGWRPLPVPDPSHRLRRVGAIASAVALAGAVAAAGRVRGRVTR